MLDRTAPTYVVGQGEDDKLSVSIAAGVNSRDEEVSSKVGNIPGVLRSATTRLGVASSVAVCCVSSPIAVAGISVGGKAHVRPSASMLLADVLSANTSVTTESDVGTATVGDVECDDKCPPPVVLRTAPKYDDEGRGGGDNMAGSSGEVVFGRAGVSYVMYASKV
jgi:hypothetical protein